MDSRNVGRLSGFMDVQFVGMTAGLKDFHMVGWFSPFICLNGIPENQPSYVHRIKSYNPISNSYQTSFCSIRLRL